MLFAFGLRSLGHLLARFAWRPVLVCCLPALPSQRRGFLASNASLWRNAVTTMDRLCRRSRSTTVAPQRSQPTRALTVEPLPLCLLGARPPTTTSLSCFVSYPCLCFVVGVLPQDVSRRGLPWRGAPLVPVPRLIYLPRLPYSLPEGGICDSMCRWVGLQR